MDWRIAAAAVIAYLLGPLSFARLTVRLRGSDADITRIEVPRAGGETFTSEPVSVTAVRFAVSRRIRPLHRPA